MMLRPLLVLLLVGVTSVLPATSGQAASAFTKYAALGDSVASGLGLNTSPQDPCRKSVGNAYPDLVRTALGLDDDHYKKIACAGKMSGALVTEQVPAANTFLGG